MARSLDEIAKLLDDAHEGLMIMARDAAGKGNEDKAGVEFYDKDTGAAFTLPDLANDLRAHGA